MLDGKRVIVTGASRGIGREIALAFAGAGAVIVLTARNAPDLQQVTEHITQMGGSAYAIACDVCDPQQVKILHDKAIERLGGVDILVNNAGAAQSHSFLNHPDELWHTMLTVNLNSVYYVTKAFTPPMVEQRWGRIINIASIAAQIGARYITAYTASKHGVLGLTRALAAELVLYGITVNAICPGYVDTPMTDQTVTNIVERTGSDATQVRTTLERMSPQQRLITPHEIAAMVVYLAHDHARGITGQAINIDGGTVMH